MPSETIDQLPAAVGGDGGDLPDPYEYDYRSQAKLEADVISPVCDVLRNGGTKAMAASSVGVTRETLMKWHKKGRRNVQGEEPLNGYGVFYLHSERAMSEAKAIDLAAIREAGENDWHARKWFLEKVYPDEFALDAENVVDRNEDDDNQYKNRMTREQWKKREKSRQDFLDDVEEHLDE